MNYLSVEELTKSYGERVLFENLTFGIEKGQKVAFVAKNGSGKTTLLKILSGLEGYDSGKVIFRKDLKVSYLSQTPEFDKSSTISEVIFKGSSREIIAIKEYEQALLDVNNEERLQQAISKMDELQAWDYETRIKQILGQLNIHQLNQKIEQLSGGQIKRIALAQVFIEQPDFFVLDEPTNHLDLDMIEWLENYLSKENCTLFMVTHDRYFLERVCNEIIELDNQQLYRYKGNYSYYLEKKQERIDVFEATVDKAKNLYRKELEWMRRMPKARGTKAKSREDSFYETQKTAHQRIDKSQVELSVNVSRLGSKIIELHHLKKSFGDLKILDDFNYVFKKNERIGIVGKNGVGKSTFLDILMGKTNVDSGKVNIGETVVFGYYNQSGLNLKNNQRVIEVIKDIAEFIPLEKGKSLTAAQLLEKFLFPRSMHYQFVEKLSGGEKRRLYLLTILMKNPNFLILDEPTNDLDILTLNVLEDFLEDFSGCLIVVTHDRYFMDKLVDHLFVFEGDGIIKDFTGKYSDYRILQKERETIEKEIAKQVTNGEEEIKKIQKTEKPKSKLSYKEKFELEQLEKELPLLEKQKNELVEKLVDAGTNHTELVKLTEEIGKITSELDQKSDRWLILSEYEK